MQSMFSKYPCCSSALRWVTFLFTFSLLNVLSLVYAAGTPDLEFPIIEFYAVEEGSQEDSQVFTVIVTDNDQLEEVSIQYRLRNTTLANDNSYIKKPMSQLAGTNIYIHTIAASEISFDTDKIEYYIQARDRAGNLALEGFNFDPLVRTLLPASPLVDAGDQDTERVEPAAPEIGMSTSRKLLYGALGVVVVGALISASGSSGGGDSPLSDESGVGVTVLVDPLVSQ